MRGGNGLTYPSCWRTAEGKTQYIFDVTIRDAGMIVRDATPTRASDPDLKLVAGVARNELINEKVFDNETAALFKYSQSENCRFYSIVRDDTGSTNKARYKKMLSIVESHFYKLLRPELSTDVPMSGPYQPPKP